MPLDRAVMDYQTVGLVDTPAGRRLRVVVVVTEREGVDAVARGAAPRGTQGRGHRSVDVRADPRAPGSRARRRPGALRPTRRPDEHRDRRAGAVPLHPAGAARAGDAAGAPRGEPGDRRQIKRWRCCSRRECSEQARERTSRRTHAISPSATCSHAPRRSWAPSCGPPPSSIRCSSAPGPSAPESLPVHSPPSLVSSTPSLPRRVSSCAAAKSRQQRRARCETSTRGSRRWPADWPSGRLG